MDDKPTAAMQRVLDRLDEGWSLVANTSTIWLQKDPKDTEAVPRHTFSGLRRLRLIKCVDGSYPNSRWGKAGKL